ncbi:MAG TPA: hypothetical protein VGL81_33570 [Polyangiaceae bacterium]|jgi:hypothetical protein
MKLGLRLGSTTLAACTLLLTTLALPPVARADDAGTPCGNFDFSQGISCQIEVSGGCTADCTPLKLEAGCTGSCSMLPDIDCSNACQTTCTSTCSPSALDCMAGCHGECDQPTTTTCQQQDPTADCVSQAQAQCDMHCKETCTTPPTDCSQVCETCCDGSCSAQINFNCDFQCFANLQGGCSVQCQKPAGAIFCNGQYVNASDVDACITYLATQGVTVDISARGSVQCDSDGCNGTGNASAGGCAVGPASTDGGSGGLALAVAGLFVGTAAARSLRRRARRVPTA